MKLRWPDDQISYSIISAELPFLDTAINACSEFRLALQAGGNAGLYPLRLAEVFDHVVTVEPDAENYGCLVENIRNHRNILAFRGAIGGEKGMCGIKHCIENAGASHITSGDEIPMFTIDSMGLEPNLIQLDIEGLEMAALRGAEETLKLLRPVVMIEDVGHGERYGSAKGSCAEYLDALGYEMIATNGTDTVWR